MTPACAHIAAVGQPKHAREYVCETCVTTGDTWVHLRTCQTCGVTLCCDSSPNRHASGHARSAQHAVIASAEPGERWFFCYVDNRFARY